MMHDGTTGMVPFYTISRPALLKFVVAEYCSDCAERPGFKTALYLEDFLCHTARTNDDRLLKSITSINFVRPERIIAAGKWGR